MTGSPPDFSWRQRLVIFLAGWVGWALIGAISATMRIRVEGWERLEPYRKVGKSVILTCWHNQIFTATWLFRHKGAAVITSRHFDGEYIARIIERFGFNAVRGSSTRGGTRAILEVRKHVEAGRLIGIMVDGPKGPRYRVKAGPLFLSRVTGVPLMPLHVEAEKRWELNSWDRFRIPKPFSRAVMRIGPAVALEGTEEEQLERYQAAMEKVARECEEMLAAAKV